MHELVADWWFELILVLLVPVLRRRASSVVFVVPSAGCQTSM